VRRFAVLVVLSTVVIAVLAFAQGAAGDWTGQLNSGFKVLIHLEKTAGGCRGHLTNPSGNETDFDEVTSDSTHLHFAISKLNLSYDGVWDEREKAWNGNLTFQQVYPLMLKPATASDLKPVEHKGHRKPQSQPSRVPILSGMFALIIRPVIISLPERSVCRAGRACEKHDRGIML
jgi:hypothetical protein